MKNSVILQVTNDEYELPVACFEGTKDMARSLGIDVKSCLIKIHRNNQNPKSKFKFIRVWLNKNV